MGIPDFQAFDSLGLGCQCVILDANRTGCAHIKSKGAQHELMWSVEVCKALKLQLRQKQTKKLIIFQKDLNNVKLV